MLLLLMLMKHSHFYEKHNASCRDWPTIPQLYVKGEFIGGCDIITAMHESGELKEVLEEVK